MSSDKTITGFSARPLPDLSASSQPGLVSGGTPATPDASLSAAFRHVLGSTRDSHHLTSLSARRGQGLAKCAKAAKPGGRQNLKAGKPGIGPRSGHK